MPFSVAAGKLDRLGRTIKQGVEAGEGAWLLALDMQWTQDRDTFEKQPVDYAVAFELSPPSWEPPPAPPQVPDPALAADAAAAAQDGEMIVWTGVLTGSALPPLSQLMEQAQRRAIVPIDMSGVERIDFVCAGALLNAINRVEAQRKAVQILGVSPMVRTAAHHRNLAAPFPERHSSAPAPSPSAAPGPADDMEPFRHHDPVGPSRRRGRARRRRPGHARRGDREIDRAQVRRLYHDKVLAGFAGATADAFTLFERFEAKLEKRRITRGPRSAREGLAQRSSVATPQASHDAGPGVIAGRHRRRAQAGGIVAIGSGGAYAQAAARLAAAAPCQPKSSGSPVDRRRLHLHQPEPRDRDLGMSERRDVVVAGAGLPGLALAAALAQGSTSSPTAQPSGPR
jgi:ABC-type transporter Mla MlaB component